MGTYRDHCRPIIASVLAELGKQDMKALRRALRAKYPFQKGASWPYKVWLSEIRLQIKAWPSSNLPRPTRTKPPAPNQLVLHLQSRPVDHGNIDLRTLGVQPIEDQLPTPIKPCPNAMSLFENSTE